MKKVITLFSFIFVAIFVRAFTPETSQLDGTQSIPLELNDSLIGKFNGIDIDTLICEPIGNPINDEVFGELYLEWKVFTKQGTTKDITIRNTTGIRLVNEGDLDGNGFEEWGFLNLSPNTSWTYYYVFTAINGKWHLLIDPVFIWSEHVNTELNPDETITLQDIVSQSDINGYVNVRMSVTDEDVIDYSIGDSLLEISPKEYITLDVDW